MTQTPKNLPEWIVYTEIVKVEVKGYGDESSRVGGDSNECDIATVSYVKGVTAIEPSWLHSLSQGIGSVCELSLPLEAPPPEYSQADGLICCTVPCFGPKRWTLPSIWIKYPTSTADLRAARTRWFARLLFEGKVVDGFGRLRRLLSFKPSHFTSASTMNSPQQHGVIQCLKRRKVYNRLSLIAAIKHLKEPVRACVKRSHRDTFETIWADVLLLIQ